MVRKTEYKTIRPYKTKDGSIIRELMHPEVHGNHLQSLAEAVVPVGGKTIVHRHRKSEELYHITQGTGIMKLGTSVVAVKSGDTVCIPPGQSHEIRNSGETSLRILCCCAPPYSHDDTELMADP